MTVFLFEATFERANWWLRDVVSATNFANVNNNGNANYNNASNSNGVRPDFTTASPQGKLPRRGHGKGEAIPSRGSLDKYEP